MKQLRTKRRDPRPRHTYKPRAGKSKRSKQKVHNHIMKHALRAHELDEFIANIDAELAYLSEAIITFYNDIVNSHELYQLVRYNEVVTDVLMDIDELQRFFAMVDEFHEHSHKSGMNAKDRTNWGKAYRTIHGTDPYKLEKTIMRDYASAVASADVLYKLYVNEFYNNWNNEIGNYMIETMMEVT